MSNIRGQYWLEATENIREANGLDISDPEFWAAWVSALVNSAMASVPDSVIKEVDFLVANRGSLQKGVQGRIEGELNA